MESDYPKRKEVEARFTKKKTFYKGLLVGVSMILIGVLTSYFVTFTTLSACFLSVNPQGPNELCSVIPGYSESLARNDTILQRFENLIKKTQENSRRIEELESNQ